MKKFISLLIIGTITLSTLTGCAGLMMVENQTEAKQEATRIANESDIFVGAYTKALWRYSLNPNTLTDKEWDLVLRASKLEESGLIRGTDNWEAAESPSVNANYLSQIHMFVPSESVLKTIEYTDAELVEFKKTTLEGWEASFDKDGNVAINNNVFNIDESLNELPTTAG